MEGVWFTAVNADVIAVWVANVAAALLAAPALALLLVKVLARAVEGW
jgi:hypothetical protein